MSKLLTVEAVREVERLADESGLPYAEMMQRAGRVVALRAKAMLARLPQGDPARVTVLVGSGNNGGDGLVAGKLLAEETDAQVRFYIVKRRDEADEVYKAVLDAGLFIAYGEDDLRYRVLHQMVASASLVIDALYGIGITLPLRQEAAALLRAASQALHEAAPPAPFTVLDTPAPQTPRPLVLAVDCPSGLDADTGAIDRNTLPADETVTFIAPKVGLFTFPGAASVGRLTVSSLGVDDNLSPFKATKTFVVDSGYVRDHLPTRPDDAHKGTFGKAIIVGGSSQYIGAPGLSALAAYRAGAGLVTVAAPQPVVASLAGQIVEATWLPLTGDEDDAVTLARTAADYDALLVGPGIGRGEATGMFIQTMLQTVVEPFAKLVIDADALNWLADIDNWHTLLPPNTILTPHPGEMARLTGLTTQDVQAQRLELAKSKAQAWYSIVVLKGAHTVVAAPDGKAAVLPIKTSALAKAGTGDVLAGLICGLLAQRVAPFEAAVCGAYLHGLAGVAAAKVVGSARSVVASDVLSAMGGVFAALE